MAVLQDININVHGQPSEKRLQTFLRLSQNENGRMINFRVLGTPLPSNCTATFSGTKPDGNVYSKTGTVAGNFVIIQEDMQMTAVAGVWDAKLDIINGSHNIMTALIRVVIDADVVDPDAIASDSQLQGLVAEAKYYAEHARTDAYGSPLTASTKSAMTDKTRVYVYTGSESGMTAGNWYYWNGSAWTSGGVYNAVAVQTDTTLSVAGKAADGKATGDALDALKEDLSAMRSYPVLTWGIGKNIGATGSPQNNQYMALTNPIPVDSGDVIVRTAQAKDTNNKALLFYVNTYNQTTWIARIDLSYGQSYTIPNNITAIRIGFGRTSGSGVTMTQGDVDTYFSADFYTWSLVAKQRTTVLGTSFASNTKIGVYNFGGHAIAPYKDMTDAPSETFGGGCMIVLPAGSNAVNRLQIIYDLVNLKAYRRYLSYNNSTASYTVGDWAGFDFGASAGFDFGAPFVLSKTLDTSATLLSQNTDVGLYRVGSFAQEPMATYIANGDYPDAKYGGGWMLVLPSGGNNGVCQVVYDVVNGYTHSRYISGNSLQNVGAWDASHGIKWAAIGDSITYGVYSTGASASAVDQNKCYAKRVANLIGAEVFDNFGVRGLGYINNGNNGETLKDDVIDNQDIDWTDYNLITVALGVNDYYGNRTLGTESDEAWSDTVYGKIRGTIESLMTYNPTCKLIFITPFNMAKSGSLSTHWGKGYAKTNIGTLADVRDAIIYCCDYYGIEYINETDYSVINDLNIDTLLPDSLHPSSNAHALIARELAKKLNFS